MQTIVLVFGLVAAILGIYVAETPPYTHVAALCVAVATIFGIVQGLQADAEARFVQQVLSYLARSVPASSWWKEHVDDLIQKTGASRGFRLYKAYYDSSDPRDPEAHKIFLFKADQTGATSPGGVLVVTPGDYSQLSLVSKRDLPQEIAELMFGQWADGTAAAAAQRVVEAAVALYSLPRVGKGFRVASQPHGEGKPLVVETGTVRISFDGQPLMDFLRLPPLKRDLAVAKEIEKADPDLTKFLS